MMNRKTITLTVLALAASFCNMHAMGGGARAFAKKVLWSKAGAVSAGLTALHVRSEWNDAQEQKKMLKNTPELLSPIAHQKVVTIFGANVQVRETNGIVPMHVSKQFGSEPVVFLNYADAAVLEDLDGIVEQYKKKNPLAVWAERMESGMSGKEHDESLKARAKEKLDSMGLDLPKQEPYVVAGLHLLKRNYDDKNLVVDNAFNLSLPISILAGKAAAVAQRGLFLPGAIVASLGLGMWRSYCARKSEERCLAATPDAQAADLIEFLSMKRMVEARNELPERAKKVGKILKDGGAEELVQQLREFSAEDKEREEQHKDRIAPLQLKADSYRTQQWKKACNPENNENNK